MHTLLHGRLASVCDRIRPVNAHVALWSGFERRIDPCKFNHSALRGQSACWRANSHRTTQKRTASPAACLLVDTPGGHHTLVTCAMTQVVRCDRQNKPTKAMVSLAAVLVGLAPFPTAAPVQVLDAAKLLQLLTLRHRLGGLIPVPAVMYCSSMASCTHNSSA